ncbi:MAG TPA: ribosomal protein S18-alanine N-acetyltransferase [Spirochaetota bacterium]|nr:ribosomal protein S18-alanine N-acetyltransferase [Spirochaetota bacterium]HPV42735.1 ribosomal protein S18-alanine N-acetyltransferase [Spirochaetota bacterium]
MISIRTAAAGDLDAVCAIEREGHARWSRRQFADELGLNFSRFYVMEEDGTIVGFAVAWIVADEIQLNNIGIMKDRRLRGLGSRLLERIISDARGTHDPVKIFLEVSARNTVAQTFYRKAGFVETGRRKNYYDGVDAILMERVLTR